MSDRQKSGCLKKVGCAVLVLLALAAVAVAAAGAWIWRGLHEPYRGWTGAEAVIQVEPGTGGRAILDRLESEGVLKDATLARLFLVHALGDPPLKAGEYRFDQALSTPQVLDKLIRGEVVTHSATVIEGLTLEETADHLAAAGFGNRAAFAAAMRSPEMLRLVADLDPAADDLEGYLFPDTYQFARGTPEEAIVRTLVEAFVKRYREQVAPLLAASQKSGAQESGARESDAPVVETPRQLVTLASIVEKEAGLDEERPLVASVYANRLRRGMPLQADPTVIFALKRQGTWNGNLRRPDLKMDSPYNTYRYPRLPPGPIASPGLASLLAAAQPAQSSYLYFVSRNDGSHVFASTYAEHQKNVYRWQKLYWRKRWAEEREGKR